MSPRSASTAEGMLIANIGAIDKADCAIDKADYEVIRIAGLAHIISISRMYIVVIGIYSNRDNIFRDSILIGSHQLFGSQL